MKKVSVILVDWSVRESFHAIDYLNRQTIPRSDYEIIWVEYYEHRPEAIQEHVNLGKVDKWIVLNKTGMYIKHLMYNEGIVASEGDIVVICDSDALFSPTFIESILTTFDKHKRENIVLYLEEVRSNNKHFYPFKNASWGEVMTAPGLVNWDNVASKPLHLTTTHDMLHYRNYGACFCARRKDIIEVGGYDEHSSYHSFLCGPYELGWRMVNRGYQEIWHQNEWILHVWHPWVRAGADIMGESDGRLINAMALEMRKTGRVAPLVENEKIRALRTARADAVAIEIQPEKLSIVPDELIESKKARFKHNLHTLKSLIKCLLTRVKVDRVLVVTEDDQELLYWIVQLAGFASRTRIFNYTRLYHRLGQQEMSEQLLEKCKKFKPELVIFVPLANAKDQSLRDEVEPTKEVISRIVNKLGIKVHVHNLNSTNCGWYDKWISLVSRVGITNSVSEFDKHADDTKVIQGYPAVYPLDFYDKNLVRDIDVSFWGSVPINSGREEYIDFLRASGIKVYTREYRVPARRYAEILNRSKISLSLSHDGKKGQLRNRAFEIMACKSLLLEDSAAETGRLFDVGKDFDVFRNKEELLEKVRFYLQHEEERKAIAQSGYDKVTNLYNARNLWAGIFKNLGFDDKGLWSTCLKIAYSVFESLKWALRRVLQKMLPVPLQRLLSSVGSRVHISLAE